MQKNKTPPKTSVHHNQVWVLPGVRRMTDIVMREQTTSMTSRAIAIPFQFLWGGLTPPRSCRETHRKKVEVRGEISKAMTEWLKVNIPIRRITPDSKYDTNSFIFNKNKVLPDHHILYTLCTLVSLTVPINIGHIRALCFQSNRLHSGGFAMEGFKWATL